jgi:hypothetical protein
VATKFVRKSRIGGRSRGFEGDLLAEIVNLHIERVRFSSRNPGKGAQNRLKNAAILSTHIPVAGN